MTCKEYPTVVPGCISSPTHLNEWLNFLIITSSSSAETWQQAVHLIQECCTRDGSKSRSSGLEIGTLSTLSSLSRMMISKQYIDPFIFTCIPQKFRMIIENCFIVNIPDFGGTGLLSTVISNKLENYDID